VVVKTKRLEVGLSQHKVTCVGRACEFNACVLNVPHHTPQIPVPFTAFDGRVVFEVETSDGEAPGNRGRTQGGVRGGGYPFPSQWVRGEAPEALRSMTFCDEIGC